MCPFLQRQDILHLSAPSADEHFFVLFSKSADGRVSRGQSSCNKERKDNHGNPSYLHPPCISFSPPYGISFPPKPQADRASDQLAGWGLQQCLLHPECLAVLRGSPLQAEVIKKDRNPGEGQLAKSGALQYCRWGSGYAAFAPELQIH